MELIDQTFWFKQNFTELDRFIEKKKKGKDENLLS